MILVLLTSAWLAAGLKHRATTPHSYESLTVAQVLKASPDKFKVGDAMTLDGYVASERKEADGDWHLEIAATPSANRAHSVVCEIVPTRPLTVPAVGTKVTVSGWVYWDGHHKHEPGRGTCWECHPITSIKER